MARGLRVGSLCVERTNKARRLLSDSINPAFSCWAVWGRPQRSSECSSPWCSSPPPLPGPAAHLCAVRAHGEGGSPFLPALRPGAGGRAGVSDGADPGSVCQFPLCSRSVGKWARPCSPLSCPGVNKGWPAVQACASGVGPGSPCPGSSRPQQGDLCPQGPQAQFLPHPTLLPAKETKGRHKARKCHREQTRQLGGRQETGWCASPD